MNRYSLNSGYKKPDTSLKVGDKVWLKGFPVPPKAIDLEFHVTRIKGSLITLKRTEWGTLPFIMEFHEDALEKA